VLAFKHESCELPNLTKLSQKQLKLIGIYIERSSEENRGGGELTMPLSRLNAEKIDLVQLMKEHGYFIY